MNFLSDFHGALALVLLCALLFAEEAGVPLPFAPGELTLLAGGLLIAAGGLDPYVFGPLAFASCVAGAVVGFSWARLVGERGLTSLAGRLHQTKALQRVANRVRQAGPVRVGVARLIPGLRIYTTLVAGAFGVPIKTFLVGIVPATAIWVAVFVALGALVGIPVEHFLGSIERLAVQGAILLLIGVGGYVAVRHAPQRDRDPLVHVPVQVRVAGAVAVDITLVASVVAGIISIVRRISGIGLDASWVDVAVVVGVIAAFYVVLTRRGTGATVGEALLHVGYVKQVGPSMHRGHFSQPRGTVSVQRAARLLRTLGSGGRLRVAQALLAGSTSAQEIATATALDEEEVRLHLAALAREGVVEVAAGPDADAFKLSDRYGNWIAELLAATSQTPPPADAALAAEEPSGARV